MTELCPRCGAPEIDKPTQRTVYACGSSDYDQRPGTFDCQCGPCGKPVGSGTCVLKAGHPHGCTETGDTLRRTFIGDVAQCGCRWSRDSDFGDVLELCDTHKEGRREPETFLWSADPHEM